MSSVRKIKTVRLAKAFCRLTLGSALLLIPLLFQTTRFEYDHHVYDLPKQTAGVVLLTFFIWGAFLLGRQRRTGASLFLSLLLAGVWLSCFRAVNVGVSLADGFVASLLVAMPMFMGRSFDSGRSLRRAVVCLLAGATLAAAYSLAQRMGWDPVLSELVGLPEQYRLGSSLGSPERTALYVAGTLPLLLAWLLSVRSSASRGILALVGVGFVSILFLGSSQAAFLTALVGCLVLLLTVLLARRKEGAGMSTRMDKWLRAIVLLLLCIVLIVGLATAPDESNSEVSVDRSLVRAGWHLTRGSPLLGIGSGNWGIICPLFHRSEYGEEIVPRMGRPTLEILRIWGEWGILGLCGFLGFAFWVLLRALRGSTVLFRDDAWWISGSTAGMLALFVSAFWGSLLHVHAMSFLFWALAAITVAGWQTRGDQPERQLPATKLMLASRRIGKAVPVFERATELVPYHPLVWAEFAESSLRQANNMDRANEGFDAVALRAAEVGEKALRFLPNEPALIFRYGNALDFQYARAWEKVIAYSSAAELSPNTPAFHLGLGRAYMYLSASPGIPPMTGWISEKRAVREWQTVLSLDPDNASAAYNLALNARNHNRPQEAVDYVSRVLRTHPNHLKARELLEELGYRMEDLEAKRNLEQIAAYWQTRIEKDPQDPGNYYAAGETYERLGNEELATLMYKKAFLKDPEYIPAIKKLTARGVSLDSLLREGESALVE
jgi:tetratricopeptide (TPR) repeat protein